MKDDKFGTNLTVDNFTPHAERYLLDRRITETQSEALSRFLALARKHRLSSAQMGEKLGVSSTTVSRVYRGLYEGDVAAVADKAALALRLMSERENLRQTFIETDFAHKIFTACDFALTRQTPVILTGLSQMGKTTAFLEYARRSDATVRYVRMPASATLTSFFSELCEVFGISTSFNTTERRRRIFRTINDRTLLIVDELHELVISSTRTQSRRVCELLREIYDRTRCGLILCGTDTLETDLLHGPDAGYLDQIVQRSIWQRLPRRISKPDFITVISAFGMPTESIPEEVTKQPLRMNLLCLICTMARDAAAKRNLPLDWSLWLATRKALLGE